MPICPALEAWLEPYAQKIGPIRPNIGNEVHFTKVFRAARTIFDDEKDNPRVTLVHNGRPLSYCSYRFADTKSAVQAALEARNRPKMLFEHYRELVTDAEANEWFSLMPL